MDGRMRIFFDFVSKTMYLLARHRHIASGVSAWGACFARGVDGWDLGGRYYQKVLVFGVCMGISFELFVPPFSLISVAKGNKRLRGSRNDSFIHG